MSMQSDAQFLKNLMKETTDKVADNMADKLSDRIAEEIAYAIMKPIDRALDSMLRHSYESDSLSGDRKFRDYSSFLEGMNRSEDVPDSYVFDVIIVSEFEDDNKKKSEATFYYSRSGDYLGMGQENNYMVMDSKNDLIVTFNTEDKKAFALPNMMKLGGVIARQEIEDNAKEYTFEKTGKTKKICGYNTYEYIGTSEDDEYKFYMAEDFPVSWVASYSGMMSQMAPSVDMGKWKEIKGMVLKSETKENGKITSKWEAKKINLDGLTIKKSDYTFDTYSDKEEEEE
jgi:hypothetical protein